MTNFLCLTSLCVVVSICITLGVPPFGSNLLVPTRKIYVKVFFIQNGLKSFGFAKLTTELEKNATNMDYEIAQKMSIAQRKVIIQSIRPTIGNVSYSIHSLLAFYILSLHLFVSYWFMGMYCLDFIVVAPCKQNAKLNVFYIHVQGSCHGTKI